MSDKCFCHLNGYEVKDAKARNSIETLNNTTSEISEDVTVLETRMNTFTALPEGTTTADAEIIDARIGADGVTYANLGEAIRNQFLDTPLEKPVRLVISNWVQGTDGKAKNGYTFEGSHIAGTTEHSAVVIFPKELKPNCDYKLKLCFNEDIVSTVIPYLTDNVSVYGNIAGLVWETFIENTKAGVYELYFKFSGANPTNIMIRFQCAVGSTLEYSCSLLEGVAPILTTPKRITENCNGLIKYQTFYEISTVFPSTYKKYTEGSNQPEITISPEQTVFGVFPKVNLKENCHYKLLVKVDNNSLFGEIQYATSETWNTNYGQFATIKNKNVIDLGNGLFECNFIIENNDVNAKYLVMKFLNSQKLTTTITFSLLEQFYYDFTSQEGTEKYIAFIGDSLTAWGYGDLVNTDEINKVTFAVGGEGIQEIFARTGVTPLKVLNNQIVSGANTLTLNNSNLFRQGMGNINPVTIAGIKGNLSLDENNNYIFTTAETIETTPIYKPEIIPYQSTLNIEQYVFWVGTNSMSTTDFVFENWLKILKVYPNSIIVGLTRDTSDGFLTMVNELNERGENEIGSRFINVHDWLVNYGLSYCGLTATDEDTTAINNNKIPPSLLSDSVHYNEYGKQCIAHLVEERLKLLNVI